jgi:hypothetical protein
MWLIAQASSMVRVGSGLLRIFSTALSTEGLAAIEPAD